MHQNEHSAEAPSEVKMASSSPHKVVATELLFKIGPAISSVLGVLAIVIGSVADTITVPIHGLAFQHQDSGGNASNGQTILQYEVLNPGPSIYKNSVALLIRVPDSYDETKKVFASGLEIVPVHTDGISYDKNGSGTVVVVYNSVAKQRAPLNPGSKFGAKIVMPKSGWKPDDVQFQVTGSNPVSIVDAHPQWATPNSVWTWFCGVGGFLLGCGFAFFLARGLMRAASQEYGRLVTASVEASTKLFTAGVKTLCSQLGEEHKRSTEAAFGQVVAGMSQTAPDPGTIREQGSTAAAALSGSSAATSQRPARSKAKQRPNGEVEK